MHTWAVEHLSHNVHRIKIYAPGFRHQGWEIRLLLSSDRHIDSPYSDRAAQERHLQEAVECNAPVIDLGDFFDVMQGRHDKRRAARDLRPQYQGRDDYLTAVVEDVAEFLRPYSSQLAVIGRGNHEQKVKLHANVDVLSALAYRLKSENPACPVGIGGYGGWVFVQIIDGDEDAGRKCYSTTVRIKYFHGSGGGGLVTRGTLDTRRGLWLPDADIVVSGHTHDAWCLPITRERVTVRGQVYLDEALHIRVPSYKDEYADGSEGWHVETGKPPKPVGAAWLLLRGRTGNGRQYAVDVDALRAR